MMTYLNTNDNYQILYFFLFVMLITVVWTPLGTQNFNLKGQKYEKGFAFIGIACHTLAKNVEIILSFSFSPAGQCDGLRWWCLKINKTKMTEFERKKHNMCHNEAKPLVLVNLTHYFGMDTLCPPNKSRTRYNFKVRTLWFLSLP